jgi:hypothetical protein
MDLYARVLPCDGVAKEVAEGRMAYDQTKGAACLDQIKVLACDSLIDEAVACADALVGRVPSGGACATDGLAIFPVCAPGNICHISSNGCGGVCKPTASPGSSCAYSSTTGSVTCADGSECQSNTDLCVVDAAEGEPCQGPTAGYCRHNLECEGGTSSTAGTCRRKRTSGACTSSSDCASSYVCAGQEGAKTCRKAKLPGDSCTPGLGECYPLFSWCGSQGTCIETRAQENQPCGAQGGAFNDYIQCDNGLTCATSGTGAGTCRKKKPAGSSCASGSECAARAYCDSTTHLCVSCS